MGCDILCTCELHYWTPLLRLTKPIFWQGRIISLIVGPPPIDTDLQTIIKSSSLSEVFFSSQFKILSREISPTMLLTPFAYMCKIYLQITWMSTIVHSDDMLFRIMCMYMMKFLFFGDSKFNFHSTEDIPNNLLLLNRLDIHSFYSLWIVRSRTLRFYSVCLEIHHITSQRFSYAIQKVAFDMGRKTFGSQEHTNSLFDVISQMAQQTRH